MTLVYDADNIDIDLKAMESLIEQVSPLSILEKVLWSPGSPGGPRY